MTDGEPSPASSLESAKATLAGLSEVDVFAFRMAAFAMWPHTRKAVDQPGHEVDVPGPAQCRREARALHDVRAQPRLAGDERHVECAGHGPGLVLLHGWGLHGGIWKGLAAKLAEQFTVITVDLPGHGHSRATVMPEQLAAITDLVANLVDEPATWLGWSLGGSS